MILSVVLPVRIPLVPFWIIIQPLNQEKGGDAKPNATAIVVQAARTMHGGCCYTCVSQLGRLLSTTTSRELVNFCKCRFTPQ